MLSQLEKTQDKINRVNYESPNIPQHLFNRVNIKRSKDAEKILLTQSEAPPALVRNVNYVSLTNVSNIDFSEEHFNLEIESFGNYASCPESLEKFKEKYQNRRLSMFEARIDNKLIGYCIFEKLANQHYHLLIVTISKSYRKHGIGKQLMATSSEQMACQGMNIFSLFTADVLLINRLFRGVADPICIATDLCAEEIEALDRICKTRKLQLGFYGNQRIIEHYYTLRDSSTLNATFKLYKI
ncbi:GNAT family N-acetyltransferase [candidate division KSB1 bacterium]